MDFGLILGEKSDYFVHKFYRVLRIPKIFFNKKIVSARWFLDKQIAGPVTFFLYDLECYFFLNDMDIQLVLEFKNSFWKYHPVFPKNP